MIEFYNVSKQFSSDSYALRDVNLKIGEGEYVFLLGPSGAGKSTLINLIYAGQQPSCGQIVVCGRNLAKVKEHDRILLRREVSVVFQDFKLIKERTVFENVELPLLVLKIEKGRRKILVNEVLKAVGLTRKAQSYPLNLSGGEQQRVQIARAIVGRPRILLADEPTGNLDEEISEQIMELFSEINLNGITVVMATHNLDLVRRYQMRYIYLQDGSLKDDFRL